MCNPLTCQALSRTRTGDLLLTGKYWTSAERAAAPAEPARWLAGECLRPPGSRRGSHFQPQDQGVCSPVMLVLSSEVFSGFLMLYRL